MEWSNEYVLTFLDLYEQHPVIWDGSHAQYKDRNLKFEGWKIIEQTFNKTTNLNLTIPDLKRKKESLMASFRSCCAKIKQSTKSGAGPDDRYKTNWFAYEKMASFLRWKDVPRETIISEDLESQADIDVDDEDRIGSSDGSHLIRETDCEETETTPLTSCSCKSKPSMKIKTISETSGLKRKMDEALAILKNSPIEQKQNKVVQDDCDLYVQLLATKLRKLDESSRDVLMNNIDNLVFKTTMLSKSKTQDGPSSTSSNQLFIKVEPLDLEFTIEDGV